jgi:hypothetical protein
VHEPGGEPPPVVESERCNRCLPRRSCPTHPDAKADAVELDSTSAKAGSEEGVKTTSAYGRMEPFQKARSTGLPVAFFGFVSKDFSFYFNCASFSEARQQDGWALAQVVEVVARREPQNSPRNIGIANLFHLHVPSPESVHEAQEAPIRVDPKE